MQGVHAATCSMQGQKQKPVCSKVSFQNFQLQMCRKKWPPLDVQNTIPFFLYTLHTLHSTSVNIQCKFIHMCSLQLNCIYPQLFDLFVWFVCTRIRHSRSQGARPQTPTMYDQQVQESPQIQPEKRKRTQIWQPTVRTPQCGHTVWGFKAFTEKRVPPVATGVSSRKACNIGHYQRQKLPSTHQSTGMQRKHQLLVYPLDREGCFRSPIGVGANLMKFPGSSDCEFSACGQCLCFCSNIEVC